MNYLILIAYITGWGVVHSALASLRIKDLFQRMVGRGLNNAYRLVYNIFSFISIAPLLWLMRMLPDRMVYEFSMPWKSLMNVGQGLALLLLFVTLLQTDVLAFIGLRQWVGEGKPAVLITDGFYHWVRHPLYFFGLLFLWLTPVMTANMLVVYISLSLYLLIGAYFEERKLSQEFGALYAEYKSLTPMFIPGLIIKRR